MRHANYCVYDEFVPKGTVSTAPAYTSSTFEKRLAHYDTLVVQVVVDDFSGSDTINLQIEHSADGRTFSPWNTSPPDISGAVPGSIVFVTSVPTASQTQPLLGYVRFAIWFAGSTFAAHVRIHVTQRDTGG